MKPQAIYSLLRATGAMCLFASLFAVCGIYTFTFQESAGTFFYTAALFRHTLLAPGGVAQLISLLLTQFYLYPWVGAICTAAILTCIYGLFAGVLHKMSDHHALWPLAMLPGIALAFLNYNVNYNNSGTIAMLMMAGALRLMFVFKKPLLRGIYVLVAAVTLSLAAGAIALLFCASALIIFLFTYWRYIPAALLAALSVWLMAIWYVKMGFYGSVERSLSPGAYFTLMLEPPSLIYMPWVFVLAMLAVACIASKIRMTKAWAGATIAVVCAVGALGYTAFGCSWLVDRQSETFKRMYYYIGKADWQAVIDMAQPGQVNNLMLQDCLNLALAETGQLSERLFEQPCYDIRSIYIEGDKNPYMKCLLSEIYWSMGHIALSQRNAFEANESLNNFSPRMLTRLALTNIVYGQYKVANKYINLLDHTMFYRPLAKQLKRYLHNDKTVDSDPVLGDKRRCLFPDNRFSGERGLDDDLRQIMRSCPQHKATLQYLGSLYLLSKDMPRFAETIGEFYNEGDTLPQAYAQAMLALHYQNPDSVISRYNIDSKIVDRLHAFEANPSSVPNTFWHFYKYTR